MCICVWSSLLKTWIPALTTPHFTSTYTYGVTIASRVCDGKFSFLNIHVLQLALRVLHRPNPATKNSNPYQKIINKNKKKKIKLHTVRVLFFLTSNFIWVPPIYTTNELLGFPKYFLLYYSINHKYFISHYLNWVMI